MLWLGMSIQHRPDRPNRPWRARVRTPDGRMISRSFERKTDAVAWDQAQRTDLRRGDWVDPRSGDISLSDWLRVVEATKLNVERATLATRDSLIRNHIDQSIGEWPINRITAEMLQQWVRDVARSKAPATVRKVYTIAGEGFRLAAARGKILRTPDVGIKLPEIADTEHRYLTEPEVWRLADAVAIYIRPFVLLGAFAGLRPGESLALGWSKVDLEAADIGVHSTLRKDGSTKGPKTRGSKRTVSIPKVLVAELAQHRERFPSVAFVIFDPLTGKPFSTDSVRSRGWRRAVRDSVGEPMRPHDLRHTHVALCIAEGLHPKVIADRLGHDSIRVTMDIYGGLLKDVGRDAISSLGGRSRDPGVAQGRMGSATITPIRQ